MKDEFSFDFDDIFSEFTGAELTEDSEQAEGAAADFAENNIPAEESAVTEAEDIPADDEQLPEDEEQLFADDVSEYEPAEPESEEPAFTGSAEWINPFSDDTAVYTPVSAAEETPKITHYADKYKKSEKPSKKASLKLPSIKKPSVKLPSVDISSAADSVRSAFSGLEMPKFSKLPKEEKESSSKSGREKPQKLKKAKTPKVRKEKPVKEKKPRRTAASFIPVWLAKLLGVLLSLLTMCWCLGNVLPAAGAASAVKKPSAGADISSAVSRFAAEENAKAAALFVPARQEQAPAEEAPVLKLHYEIPEGVTVAPVPLVEGYGKCPVDNADKIMDIIAEARASGLLGQDEKVVFSPDTEFNTGSYYQDIQYYIDDTILVITWKEIIDGNTCTFSEVKIQDGSQFRRKLAGDTFGSDMLEYTTSMHAAANSVVSMNADYYRFRDAGIVAYNRQLYRFNEGEYIYRYNQLLQKYNCIDTLFVNSSGDFSFFHMFEQSTPEDIQRYISENDIVFSLAFGPVLVENGVLNESYFEDQWYPVGEINTGYSRAGIGQVGPLHYLYMSLNHSNEKAARWTVAEFARHFYEKGVLNAYNLDGGQTGEIVFQGGEAYNHVDHVNGTSSRQVSDMIYFASAINGEEVYE